MLGHFAVWNEFRCLLQFEHLKVDALAFVRHDEVRIERTGWLSRLRSRENESVANENSMRHIHAIAFSRHGVTFEARLDFDVGNNVSTRTALHGNVRGFRANAARGNHNAHGLDQFRDVLRLEKFAVERETRGKDEPLNAAGEVDWRRSSA